MKTIYLLATQVFFSVLFLSCLNVQGSSLAIFEDDGRTNLEDACVDIGRFA